jgi:hypothetical protein
MEDDEEVVRGVEYVALFSFIEIDGKVAVLVERLSFDIFVFDMIDCGVK